jgi:transposase
MKYTIKNLKNDFPNDDACLDFTFKNRWPKGLTCPNCEKKDFYHVKGRKSYACKCGYQVSPTEGTIFHKSSTPLTLWFHAIFLMSQSKNGVAAKELERQLGVTYKCAWRMARQIRLLMSDDDTLLCLF